MRKSIRSSSVVAQSVSPIPLSFSEKMLAGAVARGIAQTILHPVDVVRTRLQARGVSRNWVPSVFIKGVIPQITLAIPAGAIQFVAFEAAKDRLAQLFPDDRLAQARTLIAGAAGATAAATCRVPQEVLKQTIQADIYPNVAVALRETVATSGPLGLYKGALATLSRDVPWNALSFMFHAQAKKIFATLKNRQPADDENLALAGMSGAVAAVIMTPVDVIKTRIMTQRVGSVQYSGIINTLRTIVREEGAGTLMKGVVPRVVFLAPLAGITFSVYEAVAANLRKRKTAAKEASNHLRGSPAPYFPARAITTFAAHFAKTPVRLARSSAIGSHLADYTPSPRVVFSMPC